MTKPQECAFNQEDIRDFYSCDEMPVVTQHTHDCPYCRDENVLMHGEYEGKIWPEHYCPHLETFRYNPELDVVQMVFSKNGSNTLVML